MRCFYLDLDIFRWTYPEKSENFPFSVLRSVGRSVGVSVLESERSFTVAIALIGISIKRVEKKQQKDMNIASSLFSIANPLLNAPHKIQQSITNCSAAPSLVS